MPTRLFLATDYHGERETRDPRSPPRPDPTTSHVPDARNTPSSKRIGRHSFRNQALLRSTFHSTGANYYKNGNGQRAKDNPERDRISLSLSTYARKISTHLNRSDRPRRIEEGNRRGSLFVKIKIEVWLSPRSGYPRTYLLSESRSGKAVNYNEQERS